MMLKASGRRPFPTRAIAGASDSVALRAGALASVVRPIVDQLEGRKLFALVYHPLASTSYVQNWENVDYNGAENTAAVWVPASGANYSINGFAIRRGTGTTSSGDTNADLSARLDDPTVNPSNALTSSGAGNTFPFQYSALNIDRTANHPTSGISETELAVDVPGTGTKTMVFLSADSVAAQNYLKVHVDNTGRSTPVRISYDLIDVDTGTDVTVQRFGLQYRIGTTGNFAAVPAGNVANAGSTVAGEFGKTTTVQATLGSDTIGASQIQIRIIAGNGSSVDQAIAVDNILVVGGNDPGALTVRTANAYPLEGTTTSFTVSRPFTSTGAITVNYALAPGVSNPATAGTDYIAASGTLSFAADELSKTVSVVLPDDAVSEPLKTLNVTLTAPTGGATLAVGTATFSILDTDTIAPTGLLLNEIVGNPSDADQGEYIEIRGTPGATLQSVYFVSIEGDGDSAGLADVVINLSGAVIGANGLLVIRAANGFYPAIDPDTGVFTTFQLGAAAGVLETGSNSYGLFFSQVAFTAGTDLDTATTYNGQLNNLPVGAQLLDIIAINDAAANAQPGIDRTYGPVIYGYGDQLIGDGPDAVTRLPTANTPTTALAGASTVSTQFYGGNLIDPNPGDSSATDKNGIAYSFTQGPTSVPGAVITPGGANYGTGAGQLGSIGIVPRYVVDEDAGTVTVTLYRAGGLAATSVDYTTTTGAAGTGTATAGVDFTSTSGTVTFASGQVTATFTVAILPDALSEVIESFNIVLSQVDGEAALILPGTARIDISQNDSAQPTGLLINEFETNPPGTDAPYEYIELRGTPNMTLVDVYFLIFEGSGEAAGTLDAMIDLTGAQIGSNGILLIKATTGGHSAPAGAGVFTTSLLTSAGTGLESDTSTFMLVYKPATGELPTVDTDYDVSNDGTLNIGGLELVQLDSIGWYDGDDIATPSNLNFVYSEAALDPVTDRTGGGGGSGWFGGATRFYVNTTPNSAAAWYYGTVGDTTSTANVTTLFYATLAARKSTNFPAGGRLTPGDLNVPIPDLTPPTVVAAAFVRDTQSIVVTFSESVAASLVAGDFKLVNETTASAVPMTINSISGDGKTVILKFAGTGGVRPDVLVNGNYTFIVRAGQVADAAGNANVGDSTTAFFYKIADFDGDRDVDFDDLLTLARNYNTAGKSFSQGDSDYDGDVDFDDLLALARAYGTSLAAPALPAEATVTSRKRSTFSASSVIA